MLDEETQVSTVWLQCILLFSMVWGMCSTLTSDSRKTFDIYLRKLLLGNVNEYPKPKSFKLTKQQLFPDKGTVYDCIYDKRNNGCWISWMDATLQVIFNGFKYIGKSFHSRNIKEHISHHLRQTIPKNVFCDSYFSEFNIFH